MKFTREELIKSISSIRNLIEGVNSTKSQLPGSKELALKNLGTRGSHNLDQVFQPLFHSCRRSETKVSVCLNVYQVGKEIDKLTKGKAEIPIQTKTLSDELACSLGNRGVETLASEPTEFSSNEFIQEQEVLSITFKLIDKGNNDCLDLKLRGKRKLPKKTPKVVTNSKQTKKQTKKLKPNKEFFRSCKEEITKNNIDKLACFNKKRENKKSSSKESERMLIRTNRYSDEAYSEWFYKYFKRSYVPIYFYQYPI